MLESLKPLPNYHPHPLAFQDLFLSLDNGTLYSARAVLHLYIGQSFPPTIDKGLSWQIDALLDFLGESDLMIFEIMDAWYGQTWKRGWRRMLLGEILLQAPDTHLNVQHIVNSAAKNGLIPGRTEADQSLWRNILLSEFQGLAIQLKGWDKADWLRAYRKTMKAIKAGRGKW